MNSRDKLKGWILGNIENQDNDCGRKHMKLALAILAFVASLIATGTWINYGIVSASETRINLRVKEVEPRLRALEQIEAANMVRFEKISEDLEEIKRRVSN